MTGPGRVGDGLSISHPVQPETTEYSRPTTEGETVNLLKRNYDLVATASTGGVFLALGVPWPFWAAWGALASYQIGNRIRHGWSR